MANPTGRNQYTGKQAAARTKKAQAIKANRAAYRAAGYKVTGHTMTAPKKDWTAHITNSPSQLQGASGSATRLAKARRMGNDGRYKP